MDLIGTIVVLVVILLLAAVVYFVLKNITHLIINSIAGLLILFLVNHFDLMQYAGKEDVPVNLATILICALGGILGAILVIVLTLLGITL